MTCNTSLVESELPYSTSRFKLWLSFACTFCGDVCISDKTTFPLDGGGDAALLLQLICQV